MTCPPLDLNPTARSAAVRARTLALPPRGLALCLALAALAGCGDDANDPSPSELGEDAGMDGAPLDRDGGTPDAGGEPNDDAGAIDGGTDGGGDSDGGSDAGDPTFGGLVPNTPWEDFEIDVFGVPGHRFWFEVGAEQLARMNQRAGGGFPGPLAEPPLFDHVGEDIYTPGHPSTYADHMVVQNADSGRVADFGQVEVKLVGESTGRSWDFAHIPNVRVDTNEYEMGKRLGDVEHLRLNNGLVGSIFREVIAHRVYRALGYPALRGTWAFLGSNVWGPDVWVPMVLIEVYKRRFCQDNAELLGGTCQNMWEAASLIDPSIRVIPESACQVDECDNTRLEDLNALLAETPPGPGFEAALEPFIDWSRFREFQCLSWMMWTGDDAIHGGNNTLLIERDTDSKLIFAPYSIDISAGQDWYMEVPLVGSTPIAAGCQAESECWEKTIATCEALIARFDDLDPERFVDEAVETLTELGMMRDGDERRAELLREWYVERQLALPLELENFRYVPDASGQCPDGLFVCGDGGCGTDEQCRGRCLWGQRWCSAVHFCQEPIEYCADDEGDGGTDPGPFDPGPGPIPI